MQWTDSPIGKTVLLFQTPRTIVGVVENFYNQPLIREPNSVIHPSVLMPATGSPILIAKLDGITPEKLSEIRKLLTNLFPSTDITVDIYREVIRAQYENELHFRNTVFVGVIVTLLISLIGLVGYTNNEIQRRSKEIAIRKVNGSDREQHRPADRPRPAMDHIGGAGRRIRGSVFDRGQLVASIRDKDAVEHRTVRRMRLDRLRDHRRNGHPKNTADSLRKPGKIH